MDKYLVYKNALVATFDEQNRCGIYNLIIKNDKIYEIDFDNRLNNDEVIRNIYPKSEIIDAKYKLIIPPFINSHLCSSYSLSKVFLKRNSYDTINNNVSLNLINKYFSNIKTKSDLKNLLRINFFKSLTNGEFVINETSSFLSKEYFLEDKAASIPYGLEAAFTSYDGYLNSYLWNNNRFHFISLNHDEEINNYSLSFLKKSFSVERNKIFLENLRSRKISDEVNRNFGKSFTRVLYDYDLLSSDLVLSNPFTVNDNDISLLSEKKVNVVLCVSDLLNLSVENFNLNELFNSDINICVGTGYLGENVLSELKSLSRLVNLKDVSYETLLKTVTVNPSALFSKIIPTNTIEKNKPADMIIFDISDLRSFYDYPEYDINLVSQHIIESLDTKDITDMIIKGNYIVKDYQNKFYEPESLRRNIKELSEKLYDIGKYFELKEKYMMKRRIKKLSNREEDKVNLNSLNEFEVDLSIDDLENTGMFTDSDFKVVRAKVNENLILSSDIISADDNVFKNIHEIDSNDSGLSVFGDEDILLSKEEEIIGNNAIKKSEQEKIGKEKVYSDDSENDNGPLKENPLKEKEPPPKKITFIKSKLRFGFNSDD